MRQRVTMMGSIVAFSVFLASPALAAPYPKDSAPVGNICVNLYEASVWEIPGTPQNIGLINKVKKGTATLADLTSATAIARGVAQWDSGPGCPLSGNGCVDFYAVSVAGVWAEFVSWFQAAAACRNAGGRLLTSAEWQVGALGTPDPGTDNEATDCNIGGPPFLPTLTGSRANCGSDTGLWDMVGNQAEWVQDWAPKATACAPEIFFGTDDENCLAGASVTDGPGALRRGGHFNNHAGAGVFTVNAIFEPWTAAGFRCAR